MSIYIDTWIWLDFFFDLKKKLAAPSKPEPWGQAGELSMKYDEDLMGGGCKWCDVGFLNKRPKNKETLN